ncbi:hypothetical protein Tco_0980900 [Tanacetum coccineum]
MKPNKTYPRRSRGGGFGVGRQRGGDGYNDGMMRMVLVVMVAWRVAESECRDRIDRKAQRIQPTLYDGSVIVKEHVVISVTDDKETLILQEESRSKMLDKQNNPLSIEKKVKISPIDYSKLNKIKEDFGKRFVTKKELDAEEAFWLKHSNHPFITPVASHTPVKVEAP